MIASPLRRLGGETDERRTETEGVSQMVALLVILLLLALLFGGLGVFVAKVFLFGVLVALILALLGGMAVGRGGRRRV